MTSATRDPDSKAIAALAESEERYHFLAENIPVQIWTSLPNGQLDYVSDQTAASFGLSATQLLVDGWQNVLHPDDLALAVERWTHALTTGETYQVEFRLKKATGEYAWHLARAVPQRDVSGAIVRWFGTNTDIEEQRQHRRQIEALAAQLRERNHLLSLEAEVGTVLASASSVSDALRACAESVVRHLDASFARIWRIDSTGEILELRASAGLYTHLDGPHARVPVGQFKIGKIAAERKPHLTNQVIGDSRVGDQAWAIREGMVAFAGYPILFGDRLLGVVAAFAKHVLSTESVAALHSVANALAPALERFHAEDKLRQSEQWLSTTLSSIGDGVIATDPRGQVTFLNPVAAALTGWTADEASGQALDTVFPIVNEETRLVVESPVAKVLREGTIVGMANHTVLIRRDGTEVAIDDSAAPIRDRSGELNGVVLVFRDAGEKRRVDAERIELLAKEARARRGAEDAHAKAEFASRAKDEFLATASHELRTPLNAILGWARLLRAGSLDPSAFLRGLETIERNAKAQVQLVEDILDGSRIITGNLHLETRSTDLAAVVQAAVDTVRPAAAAKNISLVVDVDPAASRILGDADRLQQVLWNLIQNALKFTPKGGHVAVRLQRVGTSIELSVEDDGEGIDPDFLPHVFERFRQADSTTTRRHGGLGLGLALVRHLVEAHGGRIRAASPGKDQGATFTATLPVQAVFQEKAETDHPARREERVEGALAPNSLAELTVLVVDDELDARELVAALLRAHGAEVLLASSVEIAIAGLQGRVPDAIVSDIGMPNADGYALIQRVRALESAAAAVPAIALTAYARDEDRLKVIDAGFQAYLSKPVEPEALVRRIGELVRGVRR